MNLSPVRPIAGHFGLAHFDCGENSLDHWLKRWALPSDAAGGTKVFVTVDDADRVMGYFALAVSGVKFDELPAEELHGLSAHYPVPVLTLARLAVDRSVQGQGVGSSLLLDVLQRTLNVSVEVGVVALVVDALSEDAKRFYLSYGFKPFPGDDLRLYLFVKDIAASLP